MIPWSSHPDIQLHAADPAYSSACDDWRDEAFSDAEKMRLNVDVLSHRPRKKSLRIVEDLGSWNESVFLSSMVNLRIVEAFGSWHKSVFLSSAQWSILQLWKTLAAWIESRALSSVVNLVGSKIDWQFRWAYPHMVVDSSSQSSETNKKSMIVESLKILRMWLAGVTSV